VTYAILLTENCHRKIFRFFFISFKSIVLVSNGICKGFENRVLKTFGLKRNEVIWEWRKLHNEELNDLYSSLNITPEK
jgi:hypothetical protein